MKDVSPKRVAIKVLDLEKDSDIIQTEVTQQAAHKAQDRGTVLKAGRDCVFAKEGDLVSFYRNAATPPIKDDDGTEFVVVSEEHVLVKF